MNDSFFRTELLIGNDLFQKLKNSKIALFGIGGVGSFAAEAIARCGIENIELFDADTVDITNINRQLIADISTVGQPKVEVMRERIKKINPDAKVVVHKCFFDKNNEFEYDFSSYDYVIDAIDTIASKILLIEKSKKEGVNIISSMGTGNKMNPAEFEVADIYDTSVCPLARVMRRELKKRNIKSLKVVYSKEKPLYTPHETDGNSCEDVTNLKRINSSISFVPPVAGMILASEVVKDLLKIKNKGGENI